MTLYEGTTLVILAITAIGGLGLLVAALKQLTELVQQVTEATEANKLTRLNALLTLEESIAGKRLALSEAGIAVAELGKASGSPDTNRKMEIAMLRLDEAKQMYLNSLDRLCYCLLRDLLKEDELSLGQITVN
jgi:hypothetical protein